MDQNSDIKKVLVFCQAPADIQYVIALYEKYHKTTTLSVYCINVEAMYLFLKALNLELSELVFIPSCLVNFKNPRKLIVEKLRLNHLYQKHIKKKEGYEIYFFSIWHDWLTFYFIGKFKKNNKVFFLKHYLGVSEHSRKPIGIKEKLLLFVYKYLTNFKLKYLENNTNSVLLLPYYNLDIKRVSFKINDIELPNKYLYKLNNVGSNTVLLLESNLTSLGIINNYLLKTIEVLKKLKSNKCQIFLKGHPRIGHSEEINSYIDVFIPSYIPAEFIDISSVKYVFGLLSLPLAIYANKHHNVYSFIDDYDFISNEVKMDYKNYLIANSNNKIKFTSIIQDGLIC